MQVQQKSKGKILECQKLIKKEGGGWLSCGEHTPVD